MPLALRVAVLVLAAVAPAVVPALAQTESTTTTTVPPTVTEYHTTVKGTVPDATGRWLVVAWLDIPGGQRRTAGMLWEIGRQDGQLRLTVPYVQLPTKQAGEIDQASNENKYWQPTPADLAEIAGSWDRLERTPTRPAKVDTYITGRDAFDATFTSEARTKDAQWVVQQTEIFDASSAPAVRGVNVVAILEPRDGGYYGNYLTTLLAAAPFPIPITFSGTFQLYRLQVQPTGVLSRFADLFRGCGK